MIAGIESLAGSRGVSVLRALLMDLPILIDTALKGGVLLACCAVAAHMLRFRSAALRHLVWSAGVIGHLALPFITWNAPALHWEFLPPPPWVVASASLSQSGGGRQVSAGGAFLALGIALAFWMSGVALECVRVGRARWWISRLRRGSRSTSNEHLHQALARALARTQGRPFLRIELRVSHGAVAPLVCGVIAPVILLPPAAATWPDSMLDAVLAHEIEHVRRLDNLTQLAAQIVLVLFWFDPLLWLSARRMRAEREFACDDGVLRGGIEPWRYANCLIELSRRLRDACALPHVRAYAAVAEFGTTETGRRVHALLDPSIDRRRPGNAVRASILIGMVAAELTLGALRPFHWPHVRRRMATSIVAAQGEVHR
jgi:beta-lactamase regulating signal transducer with metallopeptidase domain